MHSTSQKQPFFIHTLHSRINRKPEHPVRTYMSSFEFNMSSNWISISAKTDANYSNNGDNNIRYQVSVMPIRHVIEKRKSVSKSGDNMCKNQGTQGSEWVKLNLNQYNDTSPRSLLLQRKNKDENSLQTTKCVLLQKYSSKKQPFTWYDAKTSCLKLGGNLVKIQNQLEDTAIQNLIVNR